MATKFLNFQFVKLLTVLCWFLLIFIFNFYPIKIYAQDIQFSQFYANILYLNPAFAGSAHGLRGIAHQRLQWPSLDAKYISTAFSIDYYLKKTRSGLGIQVLKDWQGSNIISTSELSLQYSQEIALTPSLFMRAGLQGTFASRHINYSLLTFPDQFNDNGFRNLNSDEPYGADKVNYIDLSLGTMFYTPAFWLGISAHHLNEPQQSFYRNNSKLPMKGALIAGYKIMIFNKNNINNNTSKSNSDNQFYVTPTAHYKFQGKSDQLDLGIYGLYYHLIVGMWYRGIPIKQYKNSIQNNESMVLLAGWKFNNLRISYSFDFTISKLARAQTGGSHEFNITYVVEIQKKKKILKKLPCPDF